MQASIFSCSTAFLAWEMLAVLLLAMPSFIVLLLQQRQAQRGWGGMESLNITLNPQSNIPWSDVFAPCWSSHSPPQPFFLFKRTHFVWGICYTAAKLHFFPGAASCSFFSVNAPAWLFIYWIFFGWWWGYKEVKHQNTPLWSNVTIGWLAQGH